jgi:hemoglobin
MKSSELFDKIGGDPLRAVINDFYARIFSDVMIGFMFQGRDRAHLIERECELVAALLGAPGVTYKGRSMPTAHAQHTIFGGPVERRLQILRETLRDHAVDPAVQDAWIEHTLSLRAQITRDKGSECKDTGEADRERPLPLDTSDKPIKLGRK